MSTLSSASVLAPTPGAEALLAFTNTKATAVKDEEWADPEELSRWLARNMGAPKGLSITPADLAAAKELRDALVVSMLHNAAHAVSEEEVTRAREVIAKVGAAHPLTATPFAHGQKLVPLQSGFAAILGQLVASLTVTTIEGRWHRVKACGNPQCRTAFYDRTRNSAGAYCSANPCGAKMSMRSYRQRKASAAAQSVTADA
ncbi:CGNR zinc finger domain-containing protein [Arthrobacter sp. TMN-37]